MVALSPSLGGRGSSRALFLLIALGLIIAVGVGLCSSYRAYRLATAYTLHQDYVSDEIYYVDTARRILINVFHVGLREQYNWSGKTGENYYNLEHPPLGKYIIGLSMLLCGDKPVCWRLPGILEAFLTPLVIYVGFASVALRRRWRLAILAGIVAAVAAGADRILFVDASVAMLDIHLAFFTALSLSAYLAGRPRLALVMAALASTVKMSGIAAVAGVAGYEFFRQISRRKWRVSVRIVLEAVIVTALIWLVVYSPLIAYFGPTKILKETSAALKWHTTSRPEGPPTSNPPGWILNSNPFVFAYSTVYAAAETTTIVHLAALAVSLVIVLLVLALSLRGREIPLGAGSTTYIATLLLYLAVYLLGNHTLYSFYAVQLNPPAGIAIGEAILILLGAGSALRREEDRVWRTPSR